MKFLNFLFVILLLSNSIFSQHQIQPGYVNTEYIELMKVNAHTVNPFPKLKIEAPSQFQRLYSAANWGLDNAWELWINDQQTAVISVRGSTQKIESWLLNFYAAMVPAQGSIPFYNNDTFHYSFTDNPNAAVHVGWLMAVAWMEKDVLSKIDSLQKTGINGFYIVGHSQGGAIATLLTAHLLSLQQKGKINNQIQFKTYCSAAPKAGNLHFSYAYTQLCKKGWEYNVVNADDWVPEMPFSIQSFQDFNTVNPFKNANKLIKRLPFPQNLAIKYVYTKLNNPTKKAKKNYNKILGKRVYRMVNKYNNSFVNQTNNYSTNYMPVGTVVLLIGDTLYHQKYPSNDSNIFIHHSHSAYIYMANHNLIDD